MNKGDTKTAFVFLEPCVTNKLSAALKNVRYIAEVKIGILPIRVPSKHGSSEVPLGSVVKPGTGSH